MSPHTTLPSFVLEVSFDLIHHQHETAKADLETSMVKSQTTKIPITKHDDTMEELAAEPEKLQSGESNASKVC